jgi:hypothetical protein
MCVFIIKNNIYIFIIMDDSNSLSNSILKSSEAASSSFMSSSTDTDSSGFFDTLKNINVTTWLIIILILAFLGFNIFVYLAKGTNDITNFFAPIIEKIFGTSVSVTGQTIDVAAEGAKNVVSGTANVINAGLSSVQDITPNQAPSSVSSQSVKGSVPPTNAVENSTLNKALNSSSKSKEQNTDYQGVESSSSVHTSSTKTGKAGWCYIGEDRGYRTCSEVGVNDTCMSGDIFPSHEICINPNLRP